MGKKQFYIIVGIIAVLSIGFLLAGYIISKKGTPDGVSAPVNPFENFSPFGKSPDQAQTGTQNTGGVVQTGGGETPLFNQIQKSPLRQMSTAPISGFSLYLKSGKEYGAFVMRDTGNIYEEKLQDLVSNRVSNTLFPRTQEAYIGNGGKNYIFRYLDGILNTIISLSVELPTLPEKGKVITASSTEDAVLKPKISYMPNDISDMIVSRDGASVFFLAKSGDFSSRKATGSIFNFQKGKIVSFFTSSFTEWLPLDYSGNTVILQTKASQKIPGFLYSLDTGTGRLQKIMGDKNGLTALPSPDGKKILYSESTKGGVTLHLYDTTNGNITDFTLMTLPEKCAWRKDNVIIYCAVPGEMPSANYPDDWYQGTVSFNDVLWKLNVNTKEYTTVLMPESRANQPMDITSPKLSPSEEYLVFQNKKDMTLWEFAFEGTE